MGLYRDPEEVEKAEEEGGFGQPYIQENVPQPVEGVPQIQPATVDDWGAGTQQQTTADQWGEPGQQQQAQPIEGGESWGQQTGVGMQMQQTTVTQEGGWDQPTVTGQQQDGNTVNNGWN